MLESSKEDRTWVCPVKALQQRTPTTGQGKMKVSMMPWLHQSISFSSRKWSDELWYVSTSQIAMTMGQTYRAMEEAYESHPFY